MSATTTTPVYASKAAFFLSGFAPYLQPSETPDTCSICLKDLASDATTLPHKPLSAAEQAFLDTAFEYTDDTIIPEAAKKEGIYHTTSLPAHHNHHDHEEQVGASIKACGHVFGKKCIKTWLKKRNSCPMCRTVLFPTKEQEEVEPEFDPNEWGPEEWEHGGGAAAAREELRNFWWSAQPEVDETPVQEDMRDFWWA